MTVATEGDFIRETALSIPPSSGSTAQLRHATAWYDYCAGYPVDSTDGGPRPVAERLALLTVDVLMVKGRLSNVEVGCCGFAGSMTKYFERFRIVEVQHTFYEPPAAKTLQRWRELAPSTFEFAIKGWQLITHEAKSPTYRRLKTELSDREREQVGSFKWTSPVKQAWSKTLECAELLNANNILLQCPASFKPTERNLEQMRRFLTEINRNGKQIYWEPRGKDWTPPLVHDLCAELSIFHAIDPFVSASQTPMNLYWRLHGKGGWRYRYSDTDLQDMLAIMKNSSFGQSMVFFNNISMEDDAASFMHLL